MWTFLQILKSSEATGTIKLFDHFQYAKRRYLSEPKGESKENKNVVLKKLYSSIDLYFCFAHVSTNILCREIV